MSKLTLGRDTIHWTRSICRVAPIIRHSTTSLYLEQPLYAESFGEPRTTRSSDADGSMQSGHIVAQFLLARTNGTDGAI